MCSPPTHLAHPTECYGGSYWTRGTTTWPASAALCVTNQDTESRRSTRQPLGFVHETDSAENLELAQVPKRGSVCVPVHNQTTDLLPQPIHDLSHEETVQHEGLKKYIRGDIELQLATLNQYIRNKNLRPIEWTCCSCFKEQKFRESLEPLDRFRCQYPQCGVSEKGFRIYRIHDMCDQCTVLVDRRAPVTKKALRKKIGEVVEVLKKINKVYEDVERLEDFDDKQAEITESLMKARKARQEFEREKQQEEAFDRLDMEAQRRDEWTDEDGDHSSIDSQCGEATEQEYWVEVRGVEERGRREVEGRMQKRRGIKGLLGLRAW